jgi:hypothetical protein
MPDETTVEPNLPPANTVEPTNEESILQTMQSQWKIAVQTRSLEEEAVGMEKTKNDSGLFFLLPCVQVVVLSPEMHIMCMW